MSVYTSAVVDAPADRVWATLRRFHDMSWAPITVESCEARGERGETQIGAQRVLNGVFVETLLALDDVQRTLRYSIDEGPDAVASDNVTGYVGTVQVWPVTETNASFVVWQSSWESSGGRVAAFCRPIYRTLLAELKRHFA